MTTFLYYVIRQEVLTYGTEIALYQKTVRF
jgi:hypothetical protein